MQVSEIRSVVAGICAGSERPHRDLMARVSRSYGHYQNDPGLQVPKPQKIRAGKAGGLPFECLTTDLFLGCLSASTICYGNCFAARAAFQSGIDFGKRVENELDADLLRSDIAVLPRDQRYLKNGWNSDASWKWTKALELSEIVHDAGKHMVFITKFFTRLKPEIMARLANLNVELRVSISAFDTAPQLEHRLQTMEDYRTYDGVAVPQLFTSVFNDPALNARQDRIVQYLVERDFTAAENSLRIDPGSPVLEMLDESRMGRVSDTGDMWCGRLYAEELLVPALTAVPVDYTGLPSPRLSEVDREFLKSLWRDSVPTHEEVHSKGAVRKPTQCGVSIQWAQ